MTEKHVIEIEKNAEVAFLVVKKGERLQGMAIKGNPTCQDAMDLFFRCFLTSLKEFEDNEKRENILVRKVFKELSLERVGLALQAIQEVNEMLLSLPEDERQKRCDQLFAENDLESFFT